MKTLSRRLAAAAFLLAVGGVAQAVDLFTPANGRNSAGDFNGLVCIATNVSAASRTIQVRLFNIVNGSVEADSGPAVAPPGRSVQAFAPGPAGCYCRITIIGASNKELVRGAILAMDGLGDVISALPAD